MIRTMSREGQPSQDPVPSVTLQITKRDAERFLKASHSVSATLDTIQTNQLENEGVHDMEKIKSDSNKKPLHEMLFDAAQQCQDPFVSEFFDKMTLLVNQTTKSPPSRKDMQAAILLFHSSDKTTKLRHLFEIFGTSHTQTETVASFPVDEKMEDTLSSTFRNLPEVELDSESSVRLFRTVLMAISCCVHTPFQSTSSRSNGVQSSIDDSQDDLLRPLKKPKLEDTNDETATKKSESIDDEFGNACQSPSWDASLATLRDEEETSSPSLCDTERTSLIDEINEIAKYAGDSLFTFAHLNAQKNLAIEGKSTADTTSAEMKTINFGKFGEWYNETGSSIVPWLELLQHSKWKMPSIKQEDDNSGKVKSKSCLLSSHEKQSQPSISQNVLKGQPSDSSEFISDTSRTLVSFDFNGSGSPTPLLINISENNLYALRTLVNCTNLIKCTAPDICKKIMDVGVPRRISGKDVMVLTKMDLKKALQSIISNQSYNQLPLHEKESVDESFVDFFLCFEGSHDGFQPDEVDLKEFSVGFTLFCSGNKSSKLLTGFDLLDEGHLGFLTEEQLTRYLQSYLTMLVAMSLLTPASKRKHRRCLSPQRRKELRLAVESGAKWTLGHFLKASRQSSNQYTFECFASWYSSGGYNIAPWLELLDLKKVMSLIDEQNSPLHLPPLDSQSDVPKSRLLSRDRVSSLRRHHLSRQGPQQEVLYTFPLGSRRSLVVLKEDATYVREVVEQLGLLTMQPDVLWSALLKSVERRHKPAPGDVALYVSTSVFVDCMKEICPKPNRKRSASGATSTLTSLEEILANFYQCFDIEQRDRVALDELMGGLTLLCGGKKSTKLAFAFSIFDTRPAQSATRKKDRIIHTLSGEDLFLFLRSILIVTFSTCRQSLDMTDEIVGRCIADTANMICNDVMRHQWETNQSDRLDFDEFGQWYNDGGYQRAPWLELLDLNKWVLIEPILSFESDDILSPHLSQHDNRRAQTFTPTNPSRQEPLSSQPGLDADLDNSFLDEIDSMDEMDMILMQTSSVDRDELKITKSFSYSQSNSPPQLAPPSPSSLRIINPLKFHFVTSEPHGGYMLSLSPARISHFRRLLEATGLHKLDVETACNIILYQDPSSKLSRTTYDAAIRGLLSACKTQVTFDEKAKKEIHGVFQSIFDAFDYKSKGTVNAIEVACGLTILCKGKKSDKLELAFEVLDKRKRGRLSRPDMACYLQSFLTVLLSIASTGTLTNDPQEDKISTMNGMSCDQSTTTLIRAVQAGADWASSLVFRDFDNDHQKARQPHAMSFDDFASWYTNVGYSSIPWLELLDLQKWAMIPDDRL